MVSLQYLENGKAAGQDKIFTDLLLHANEECVKTIKLSISSLKPAHYYK